MCVYIVSLRCHRNANIFLSQSFTAILSELTGAAQLFVSTCDRHERVWRHSEQDLDYLCNLNRLQVPFDKDDKDTSQKIN